MVGPSAGGDATVDVDVHVDGFLESAWIEAGLSQPHLGQFTAGADFGGQDTADFTGQWEIFASANLEPPDFEDFADFRASRLAERSVDAAVVNGFSQLSRRPTPEYAAALMSATNDALLDELLAGHDDLYGLIELATQRPAAAAAEVERFADDDRVVGALIGTTGAYPPPGDESYDVIYRAAEDAGMPVVFHSEATHSFEEEFPVQFSGFESYFAVHSLAGPWTHMLTMIDLIEKGTVAKFPDLDFVFLEIDFTVVPYMTARMNKAYSMRSKKLPLLDHQPEHYVRESFHFGTHPLGSDADIVAEMADLVGADSLLFSSGTPAYDEDTPDRARRILGETLGGPELDAVLHRNAVDLFDLPAG